MNGVLEYTEAKLSIYFEKSHVDCAHCPLLETYSRNQCRRTGEYVIDTRTRGYWCPLEMEEENGISTVES